MNSGDVAGGAGREENAHKDAGIKDNAEDGNVVVTSSVPRDPSAEDNEEYPESE